MNLSVVKLKVISFFKSISIIYFVILTVLLIIIEVVWAYKILNEPSSLQVKTQENAVVPLKVIENVISLNSDKNEYKVGEKIPVTINVTSNKNTAGADLIIKYDPNLLTIVTNSGNTPMVNGTIYDDYPVNKVDGKLGLITVSGITNNMNGIVPKGVFGTITFQGKAAGNPKIFFDFTKGSTNDTNLIENQSAQDVLEEVKNLDLRIIP